MPNDKTVYMIDLQIMPQDGAVYFRSKDVPGLHLCGSNFRAMKSTVEKAIKRLFKDNRGVDVNIVWVANLAALPLPHGQRNAARRAAQPPMRIAVYPVAEAA